MKTALLYNPKCTKVVRNNYWSEREKKLKNALKSSSVSVVADEKIRLDLKVNPSKYMLQI